MWGPKNGAAAIIAKENKLAQDVHCNSHCLELAFGESMRNVFIRKVVDVSEEGVMIFSKYSPKRSSNLVQWTVKRYGNDNKLVDMCTYQVCQTT